MPLPVRSQPNLQQSPIFRQGQRWGWESRQAELDAVRNAFIGADFDADR
jgi:hypothetical protein